MMLPHCDRCNKLCDKFPSWVEIPFVYPDGAFDTVRTSIWHLVIHAGGQVPCEEKMFCRACRIAILEAHVKTLKLVKGDGGHLADCFWDSVNKRYDCRDGCEIKSINELIHRA